MYFRSVACIDGFLNKTEHGYGLHIFYKCLLDSFAFLAVRCHLPHTNTSVHHVYRLCSVLKQSGATALASERLYHGFSTRWCTTTFLHKAPSLSRHNVSWKMDWTCGTYCMASDDTVRFLKDAVNVPRMSAALRILPQRIKQQPTRWAEICCDECVKNWQSLETSAG